MEILEFSVPYNGDPKLLPEIFELKGFNSNSITEVFLSGPHQYSGSGRIMPQIDIGEFIQNVAAIHREGIKVNLVLNSTCEGTGWYSQQVMNSTMDYIGRMHNEHGIEAVTIANPLYISEVKRCFPEIEICASVLGNIDCVQRAVIYREAGADVITPDVNINRSTTSSIGGGR